MSLFNYTSHMSSTFRTASQAEKGKATITQTCMSGFGFNHLMILRMVSYETPGNSSEQGWGGGEMVGSVQLRVKWLRYHQLSERHSETKEIKDETKY